jgi:hypothetical protein
MSRIYNYDVRVRRAAKVSETNAATAAIKAKAIKN